MHCGAGTCLRVSGRRTDQDVVVRIAGRGVAVEGQRSWRTILPLATAREGLDAAGQLLRLSLVDPTTGNEEVQTALLPPGALGRPVELATLTVHAH